MGRAGDEARGREGEKTKEGEVGPRVEWATRRGEERAKKTKEG